MGWILFKYGKSGFEFAIRASVASIGGPLEDSSGVDFWLGLTPGKDG